MFLYKGHVVQRLHMEVLVVGQDKYNVWPGLGLHWLSLGTHGNLTGRFEIHGSIGADGAPKGESRQMSYELHADRMRRNKYGMN